MPGAHSIQLFAQQEGGFLPSFTYHSQRKLPNDPARVMCTPLEPIPGARGWASMISTYRSHAYLLEMRWVQVEVVGL